MIERDGEKPTAEEMEAFARTCVELEVAAQNGMITKGLPELER
jgi:hypothetical protein